MSDYFIGQIRMFGFNYAPRDWALCVGQIESIQQNQALYSLLGARYGGDAVNTYALPNLQSRTPAGMNDSPPFLQGQYGGHNMVELVMPQLPEHTHTLNAEGMIELSLDAGTTPIPSNGCYLADVVSGGGSKDLPEKMYRADEGNAGTVNLGGVDSEGNEKTGKTGSGTAFLIQNPFLAVNFSIALQGLYPSRN